MGEGGRDGRSEGGKERGGGTMWGRKDGGGKDGGAKDGEREGWSGGRVEGGNDGGKEKWKEGRMEGGREHYFLQLWVLAFNKFGSTKLLILVSCVSLCLFILQRLTSVPFS